MTPQSFSHYPGLPAPKSISLCVMDGDCPYLPGRQSSINLFNAPDAAVDPEIYHGLMDAGFRRSGRIIYQNICSGCRECIQLRIATAGFSMTRSQRRTMHRNRDLRISAGRPRLSDEKYALYQRYNVQWHGHTADSGQEALQKFLYESPVNTLEFEYRDPADALLGVGICDISARSLSSVYFYFDPAHAKRRLGVYSALSEITFARDRAIDYYYLGFWVKGCGAMRYKAEFGAHELLGTDGQWRAQATYRSG